MPQAQPGVREDSGKLTSSLGGEMQSEGKAGSRDQPQNHYQNVGPVGRPGVTDGCCVHVLGTQSGPTLCGPVDCSLLGSSVHRVL